MLSRLSLRAQVAMAVALPCLALALFSSLYFPTRLNQQASQALERQVTSVGLLAVTNAAPTMRLVRDGLANPEELDGVFAGVRAGGNVTHVGALMVSPETVKVDKETGSEVQVVEVTERGGAAVRGDLPPGSYEVPGVGHCAITRGAVLIVRCAAKDQDYEAMIVSVVSIEQLKEDQRANQAIGLWVLMATLAVGLLFAYVLSGAVAGPIGVVTRVAREVAGGDVTVAEVAVGGSGEVRSMAASVNEMLQSLKGLVTQMVALTNRLSEAAQGLIAASGDQEHVTSQQSAYVQEIAATFEELSRTAERITSSTDVVEGAANRTASSVDEARAVLNEMVVQIADIRRESNEMADTISKLNSDLQQVSRIAQVIKQVADRSDLLALNAALEGTKAGEVGRGFSLVAAEMRKLAESVAVSARDIASLMESVHASGSQAVSKAQEGVAASDKGMAVAERASSVFEQMAELSRGTREAAQQIAVATRQQKQSSEQAVQGARNVTDLVKQGVDATARTTGIAQDLKQTVNALTELTKRFKVERRS